jgi:hypothetical protein
MQISCFWFKYSASYIKWGQCHEIFASGYFPEIFAAQGALPMSLTPVAIGKNLESEKFYFVWTPLASRVNI